MKCSLLLDSTSTNFKAWRVCVCLGGGLSDQTWLHTPKKKSALCKYFETRRDPSQWKDCCHQIGGNQGENLWAPPARDSFEWRFLWGADMQVPCSQALQRCSRPPQILIASHCPNTGNAHWMGQWLLIVPGPIGFHLPSPVEVTPMEEISRDLSV